MQRIEPTVRVLLHAGLGNQMFMYAAGRALALRTGRQLLLDTSRFGRDRVYHRTYGLSRFPIQGRVVNANTPYRLLHERLASKVKRTIRQSKSLRTFFGIVDEEQDGEQVIFTPSSHPQLVLDGYWQSEKYFTSHASLIRDELTPPPPADPLCRRFLQDIEAATLPCAVCIRFYSDVPGRKVDHASVINAYRNELALHQSRHSNATYFLFSDEPNALNDASCLGVPFRVEPTGPSNEEKMYCLSRCAHFFIGYSSYHWWAAWLAPSTNKQVMYLPLDQAVPANYVPSSWSILSCTHRPRS